MIARLAIEEQMSASEVSRLISVRDNRFKLNWRAVKEILAKLGIAPELSQLEVEAIFENDVEAEPDLFGDLDLKGSIQKVSSVANSLGCGGDFANWLEAIFIDDLHSPYLIILHFQLLIQEKFDHAVSYAYEFKPRGQTVGWLTQKYIDAGVPVAKNAFLNNAKATLRFDQVWVTGRTDHLSSATALANILENIENMGSLAKDELASQIRGLLHRYIRVENENNKGVLPHLIHQLSEAESARLLSKIGEGNTTTTGILEQRLVDCFGLLKHTDDGWSSRGLGDSVFAANSFRKKLGDIEFELPIRPNPRSVSYESHGGHLTTPYVLDHLNSFEFVLKAREDELTTIASLEDWQFDVVFVAHTLEANLPNVAPYVGGDIQLTYFTFADIAEEVSEMEHQNVINENIVDRLNNGFVHPNVRQQTHILIA